jgi:hypothetical protein
MSEHYDWPIEKYTDASGRHEIVRGNELFVWGIREMRADGMIGTIRFPRLERMLASEAYHALPADLRERFEAAHASHEPS